MGFYARAEEPGLCLLTFTLRHSSAWVFRKSRFPLASDLGKTPRVQGAEELVACLPGGENPLKDRRANYAREYVGI